VLGLAGSAVAYYYVKGQVDAAQTAIAAAASAAGATPTAGAGTPATAACAKAQACCEAIAAKSANAALAKQACAAYGKLSDSVCTQQYAALKQTATALGGSCL